MNPDVIVNISDATNEVSSTDFSLILIVSDDAVKDYKEYDLTFGIDASGVKTDYPTTTDTYKKVLAISEQKPAPTKVAVIGCSSGIISEQNLLDKLNGLLEKHDQFFRVITTIDTDSTKLAIAKWAESNKKFAYIQYADTTFTSDYTKTSARLLLHKNADEFLDAAEAGYFATKIPGTEIPKFRSYNGVTASSFTAAEIAAANAKNMGYYTTVTGIAMQRSSRASNYASALPLYIDDLESRVYTAVKMQNSIFKMLIDVKKLGGDSDGKQQIEATMGSVLQENYDLGIIASDENGQPDYSTNVLNAIFNKAVRGWTNMNFEYKYLHGTETVTVSGTVR